MSEIKQSHSFNKNDNPRNLGKKEEVKMGKKLFIVFSNRGAGKMWIDSVDYDSDWSYQEVGGSHASNEFESFAVEECEKYIQQCRKESKEYVVLWNKEDDSLWIEEQDCCSGTYQQLENNSSASILNSFGTREEAENYIEAEKCVMKNNL